MHWLNGAHSAPYLYRHATMKKAMPPLCVGGAILLLWERLGGIPIGCAIRG
jgi:hypothetical protein